MLFRVDRNTVRYQNGIAEIVVKSDTDVDEYGWHVICAKKIGDIDAWKERDKFNMIIRNWIAEMKTINVFGVDEVTVYDCDVAKVKECADLNNMRNEDVMACLFEYWSQMMKDYEFERGDYC